VISWGAQGGTGGAFAPPSLYVKKGPDLARAPRRARSNARKKGSGYENGGHDVIR
jgi:hypothetical protein